MRCSKTEDDNFKDTGFLSFRNWPDPSSPLAEKQLLSPPCIPPMLVWFSGHGPIPMATRNHDLPLPFKTWDFKASLVIDSRDHGKNCLRLPMF